MTRLPKTDREFYRAHAHIARLSAKPHTTKTATTRCPVCGGPQVNGQCALGCGRR